MTGKSRYSGTRLAESSRRLLETRLPPGWSAVLPGLGPGGPGECPLELRSPDKKVARLDLRCRSQVFPRDVIDLKEKGRTATVLVAPFLSVATQRRLRELGLNYLDLTGNVRLAVGRPGLFIETVGATKDPAPAPGARRSLKGPKAGRLVRTLCEFPPPFTLSELATRAAIDGGYASRLVTWLAREDLLNRRPRGPIDAVDIVGLIRRWADDYQVLSSNVVASFLDARGISNLTQRLPQLGVRYAVTGSLAASLLAPVAPPRLAMVYVAAVEPVVEALKLRPADAGINVMLLLPFDEIVFERTSQVQGLTLAAPSQVAADLLGSPGRGPNEAEAVLQSIAPASHVRS